MIDDCGQTGCVKVTAQIRIVFADKSDAIGQEYTRLYSIGYDQMEEESDCHVCGRNFCSKNCLCWFGKNFSTKQDVVIFFCIGSCSQMALSTKFSDSATWSSW